ncbi:SIMPL domain-containing protein [bacterium]|nr:SIMPL domain-containing protein [bacterium]
MGRLALVLGIGLLVATTGFAQMYPTGPSPQDTITVTSMGTAEAPPEWAEVVLTIQGTGPTAQSALMVNQDRRDRAVSKLVEQGVKQADIKPGAPRISAGGLQQMMGGNKDKDSFFVSSTLTVRINQIDPGLVFDDAARIVDAAGAEGAAVNPMVVSQMLTSQDMIRFGVKDAKALQQKALSEAIDQSRSVAEMAAAKAGRKLGALVGLQVMGVGDEGGLMAMMRMFTPPSGSGTASASAMVAATYKVE